MKTMHVGDFKARFSTVLDDVRNGEEIVISYGRSGTNVAVLVPYGAWIKENQIRLGTLEGRAVAEFAPDYPMTDEELTGL